MNAFSRKTLAAGFVLALTFFGCSGGDKGDDPAPAPGTSSGVTDGSSSSEGGSSSSDGGSSSSVGSSSSSDDGSSLAAAITALGTEIAAADAAKEGAEVSADGSDVNPEDFWVTQAAMTALEAAITTAKAVKDNTGATQAEVEAAKSTLTTAIATFDAAKQAGTNPGAAVKTELEAALATAETAKDDATLTISTDGSGLFASDKWVTQDAMDALVAAITAAETVKNNGEATQAQVDAAKAALQAAITAFNTARQAGTLPLCGSSKYNLATQYCFNNTIQEYLFDTRDDKKYKTIKIGTQVWMAENLNYAASGSKCGDGTTLSDENTTTCDTYGRLYNWATAMDGAATSTTNPSGVQGACPSSWHLPSDAEWDVLTDFVGASAGKKLKADSDLWTSHATTGGTDEHGFAALPGGDGFSSSFGDVGSNGYWWSATELFSGASAAYFRGMYYDYEDVDMGVLDNAGLYSIRCLKD